MATLIYFQFMQQYFRPYKKTKKSIDCAKFICYMHIDLLVAEAFTSGSVAITMYPPIYQAVYESISIT